MVPTASTAAALPEPRRALPGALGCPLGLSVSTHSPEGVEAGKCVPGPAEAGAPRRAAGSGQRAAGTPTLTKSTFQTFGKEVCFIDQSMCPVPSTVHQEPICCECQAKCRGYLPVPRFEATLPYWVPLSLRPRKQVVKRQQSFTGIQEPALGLRSWYNRWRICCDGHLLLKWQQLQALHQHEPLAPGKGASIPAPLLPRSLLTLLQAVLRVVVAIRQLFWV
ncbi:uncharacterized protein C16orf95 homolog isoform X19 [Canis lupus familiaris]|uniref:uncharacterized protein C16orf95 homolog isoform X19 n=1 Tax=Canis lupus familiaris TaxID=9615 RepID=UPI000BAA24EC|nr:uncharacterized protein C16orf95 homolog isoform X19 [Canis lupus familiaris]XP_038394034.1 uncharacterized protein C16orf95 homolog isoform X14 [Canis lupus familiaris]|eukprot:XP_022274809.1 uncharacterized protein C16orf95 homolog isoform X6 [Canis lupus familiaris]